MRLSGYGVELAVKKTEYKAVDDSKVKDDTEGKVQKTDEADEDEVEGFLFGKLRFVDWVHSVHKLKMSDLLIIWHAKIILFFWSDLFTEVDWPLPSRMRSSQFQGQWPIYGSCKTTQLIKSNFCISFPPDVTPQVL